jgi:hypothetical protein
MQEAGIFDYGSYKISRVSSLGEMVDQMSSENTYITEVILALEEKVDAVFK